MKIVSAKAELAALRGLCSRDKKIAGALVSQIDSSYFYSQESVELYDAIKKYMGENGEAPTYKILLEDPELSEEARAHMRDSQVTITSVKEATKTAKILNKYRQARGLLNLAKHIGSKLEGSKADIDALLQEASTAVNVIRSKKSTEDSFVHFGKNNSSNKLVHSLLYDDNSEDVIPTGIKAFDEVSGGFARGSLVTVGANSGGGKSTLASALAVNMANRGYKVLLVPLEMSKREMTARIIANVTKTDLTKILLQKLATGEKDLVYKRYRRWVKKVKEKGGRYTIFKPEEDMDIEEIMASINAYDCDVVIIDYISLLKGVDGDDQWLKLGSTARYAKINAENMKRVNILLCQVNDEGKVRYARSISEHSSNSWIWVASKEAKETGIMKVEQPKSRNSKSFPFMIQILYNLMRVKDVDISAMDDSDPPPIKDKKKRKDSLPNMATEADV